LTQKPYLQPLDLAKEFLADAAAALGCETVRELREIDYKRCLMSVMRGLQVELPSEDRIFYRVDLDLAHQLAVAAQGHLVAFEIVREICSANILNGQPIPEPLRPICAAVLLGSVTGPPHKGRTPGEGFALKYASRRCIFYLSNAYDIPKTRTDASKTMCAADYVHAALKHFDVHYSFEAVRDFTRRAKDPNFSLWSAAFDDLLDESLALEFGLITKPKLRVLHPWGQYTPIRLSRPKGP
jgi:hypothetical protein